MLFFSMVSFSSCPHLEASDSLVFLKLFAIFEPLESWCRVTIGQATKLDRFAGGNLEELILHLIRMSPNWSHCWGTDRIRWGKIKEAFETTVSKLNETTMWTVSGGWPSQARVRVRSRRVIVLRWPQIKVCKIWVLVDGFVPFDWLDSALGI